MSKRKLQIFSFNSVEEFMILQEAYGHMGDDLMRNVNGYTLTAQASLPFFKEKMKMFEHQMRVVCNNGDLTNYVLGWCEVNNVAAEVITVYRGKVRISPTDEEGFLTNWSYGWYLPDDDRTLYE